MQCSSQSVREDMNSPAAQQIQAGLQAQREQADGRIFWLLVAQWAVILVTSFTLAARWNHSRLDALSSVVVWVGGLSFLPLVMVMRSPGSWATRWAVIVSQSVMSSLLWYISGGRPDTHLHLFAWLVVFALYRDVSALLAAVSITAVGHLIVYAGSSLPVLAVDDPTLWLTNSAWIMWLAGETAFLTTFVVLDRQALRNQAERDQALEALEGGLQEKANIASRKLMKERDLLKIQVAQLIEHRASLESENREAANELLNLRSEFASQATAILGIASHPADSSLPRAWRARWQLFRQQAQHLMHLIDLPSLQSDEQAPAEPADQPQDEVVESEKRAMILMRNPLHQEKTADALESEGYLVDIVPNGPRAYYSAMLNDYSVVMVDIDLPGDEGFDTLEAMRLLPPDRSGRPRYLFAITTELNPDRVFRCTNLGVDGMFLKPLKAESLHQAMHRSPELARGQ